MMVMNAHTHLTVIPLDLDDGEYLMMIRLYIKPYTDTCNWTKTQTVVISRLSDTSPRTFFTYITENNNGDDRVMVEIVRHEKLSVPSMLG